jgi:hypothetical protein
VRAIKDMYGFICSPQPNLKVILMECKMLIGIFGWVLARLLMGLNETLGDATLL